jgi:hypothetical protein
VKRELNFDKPTIFISRKNVRTGARAIDYIQGIPVDDYTKDLVEDLIMRLPGVEYE